MRKKYKTFFKELFISIILSLYPVSYLYQVNSDKLLLKQTMLPYLIVSLTAFTIFLFFKFLYIVKIQINNIYITIPILCIILFFYGFFFDRLHNHYYLTGYIRNRFMLPLVLVMSILLIYYLSSMKNKIAIQAMLYFLFTLNVLPYLNLLLVNSNHQQNAVTIKRLNVFKNLSIDSKDPDIYYIILDMYPSAEVLEKYWDFDNSKFLSELTKKGFKVFPHSKSNYPITYLALNSILNMDYIHKQNGVKLYNLTEEYLKETLALNRTSEFLKNRGYNYYIFEGGIIPKPTNMGIQDHYLSPDAWSTTFNYQTTPDNDFLLLFINNSIISPITDRIQSLSSNIYRKRVYYVFDKLKELGKQSDKKFVIAHIMCPHSPYIFGENGEEVFVDEKSPFRRKAFIQQLKFINKKIMPVIEQIVKDDNGRDKIILLQGDHGTREIKPNKEFSLDADWVQAYYGNLNAIYMSNKQKNNLISYVAPVNTFRQVFNLQFGENLEILADRKYYTDYTFPLIFHKLNISKKTN